MKTNQILKVKWGYDQTNIEWYKILKMSGDFATIVKLKSVEDHDSESMTYISECTAIEEGSPFRRKIHKDYDNFWLKISDGCFARLANDFEIEYGVKGTTYA